MQVCIHIVDGAAIDTYRSQQPCIITRAREIAAHRAILKKYRTTGIAALNRAVEIVPLIHPANWSIGRLYLVQRRKALLLGDLAKQRECSIENTAIIRARNDEVGVSVRLSSFEPEPITAELFV